MAANKCHNITLVHDALREVTEYFLDEYRHGNLTVETLIEELKKDGSIKAAEDTDVQSSTELIKTCLREEDQNRFLELWEKIGDRHQGDLSMKSMSQSGLDMLSKQPIRGPSIQNQSVSLHRAFSSMSNARWSVTRQINHRGGTIELHDFEITLIIPPGAISDTNNVDITLGVSFNRNDLPHMSKEQTLISPVVFCEPTGFQFLKPVCLILPHCAILQQNADSMAEGCHGHPIISAWCSETKINDSFTAWRRIVTSLSSNNCSKAFNSTQASTRAMNINEHAFVYNKQIAIWTKHFTLFTTVAESGETILRKGMQIIAYSTTNMIHQYLQLRVYCVNGNMADLKALDVYENQLQGKLCAPPQPIIITDNNEDLLVVLSELPGSMKVLNGVKQIIPFYVVWHELRPYSTFQLRIVDTSESVLLCSIVAYQRSTEKLKALLFICQDIANNSKVPRQRCNSFKESLKNQPEDGFKGYIKSFVTPCKEKHSTTCTNAKDLASCSNFPDRHSNYHLQAEREQTPTYQSFYPKDTGQKIPCNELTVNADTSPACRRNDELGDLQFSSEHSLRMHMTNFPSRTGTMGSLLFNSANVNKENRISDHQEEQGNCFINERGFPSGQSCETSSSVSSESSTEDGFTWDDLFPEYRSHTDRDELCDTSAMCPPLRSHDSYCHGNCAIPLNSDVHDFTSTKSGVDLTLNNRMNSLDICNGLSICDEHTNLSDDMFNHRMKTLKVDENHNTTDFSLRLCSSVNERDASVHGMQCGNFLVENTNSHAPINYPVVGNKSFTKCVLPFNLRMTLISKLDPFSVFGKDWRMLASKMGLDHTIPLLMTRQNSSSFSPTDVLLEEWISQNKPLTDLVTLMEEIGRKDVAQDLRVFRERQQHEKLEFSPHKQPCRNCLT